VTVDIEIEVKIHNYTIKQIRSIDTIRALGMFMNPSLTSNKYFKVIVQKVKKIGCEIDEY